MISLQNAHDQWTNDIRPHVIETYGKTDGVALSESWNDYTDSLCKEGDLTDLQYHYCPAYDEPMPAGDDPKARQTSHFQCEEDSANREAVLVDAL